MKFHYNITDNDIHGDRRMSQFFEILSMLKEPRALFLNEYDGPLFILDKIGFEELENRSFEPIFCDQNKLLWEEIASIDFEEGRMGRFHMPQISFEDLDALSQDMCDEKIALLKKNCGHFIEPWKKYYVPYSEIDYIQIDGTDLQKSLKGCKGRERTDILIQAYKLFTDKPVRIVADRMIHVRNKKDPTPAERLYLDQRLQYDKDLEERKRYARAKAESQWSLSKFRDFFRR